MKYPSLQRRTLVLVVVLVTLLVLFVYVALRSGPLTPVAVTVAEVVACCVPVVCKLEHSVVRFITVADKSQCELAVGVILFAQEFHLQYILIKKQ